MVKILILPLHGIGDVLMTTPALRRLKEGLNVRITYLHMFETTRDILIGNPHVDENIHFPFFEARKIDCLRFLLGFRKRFNYSLNFYPSNRRSYNIAALAVSSPVRIGHRYLQDDLRELNFIKTHSFKEDDNLHCVEENLRLLEFLGVNSVEAGPLEVYLRPDEQGQARQWLKDRGLSGRLIIGIHPGSGLFKNNIERRWPADSFIRLIKRISSEFSEAAFLVFIGPEEKELKDLLVSKPGDSDKIFFVEARLIREAASIIENCKIFISNDSGLMHLAAALIVNDALVAAGLPALTLLSADKRLLNAAQAEGLATDNPNVHP